MVQKIIFLIYFLPICAFSQSKYPADSFLKDTSQVWYEKIPYLPIAAWQRVSYNVPLFYCPYQPSCSSYGLQSFHEHGFLIGWAATSSRLLRCTSFSSISHKTIEKRRNKTFTRYYDGRILDPILTNENKMGQVSEIVLSTMLPGSGMIKQKRFIDGSVTMLLFAGSIYSLNKSIKTKQIGFMSLFSFMSVSIYMGNIYSTVYY